MALERVKEEVDQGKEVLGEEVERGEKEREVIVLKLGCF